MNDVKYILGRPLLGKILVLSRSTAKEFAWDKPWACISIATYQDDFPKINKVQLVDLLQLSFKDYEMEVDNTFTSEQAKLILNFADKHWANIDLLMIHCYAGLSRSPGVAKALSEIYQPEFFPHYDHLYLPKKIVYQTIRDVYVAQTK